MKKSFLKNYGFLWVTLGFFAFSVLGHWIFGWLAFAEEQTAHQQPVEISGYVIEMMRDTLENWQSEFLQLIWQVAGLAMLLHVGSPQSKEGDERKEAKLDAILKKLDPDEGEKTIRAINRQFYAE